MILMLLALVLMPIAAQTRKKGHNSSSSGCWCQKAFTKLHSKQTEAC